MQACEGERAKHERKLSIRGRVRAMHERKLSMRGS